MNKRSMERVLEDTKSLLNTSTIVPHDEIHLSYVVSILHQHRMNIAGNRLPRSRILMIRVEFQLPSLSALQSITKTNAPSQHRINISAHRTYNETAMAAASPFVSAVIYSIIVHDAIRIG